MIAKIIYIHLAIYGLWDLHTQKLQLIWHSQCCTTMLLSRLLGILKGCIFHELKNKTNTFESCNLSAKNNNLKVYAYE